VSSRSYGHGIGVGDINGDKRLDLLDKDGWWEQPEKLDDATPWTRHDFSFAGGLSLENTLTRSCEAKG